jgi:hypothetical protein
LKKYEFDDEPEYIKDEESFFNKVKKSGVEDSSELGKMPGLELIDSRSRKIRRAKERQAELKTKAIINSKVKPVEDSADFSGKIPPLIFIANKCEDGFEGDILSEFYLKFPTTCSMIDEKTGEPIAPLFMSAEHGDGLTDLLQRIQASIPSTSKQIFIDRQEKRLKRFEEYKKMLLDEIVLTRTDEINLESQKK